MCGICGKIDFKGKPIPRQLIKRMNDSLSYRGPDDDGIFLDDNIGLGHRRLSIIDLSDAGQQPLQNEDGNISLIFNGEIYNFPKIREDLLSKGHKFKSHTDCEVLIHLYEEKGLECLKELNGMFAFALWDKRKKRLWLARDRLGIKPIIYYYDGQKLVFGSELKAILCDPDIIRDVDLTALDLYMTLSYIPAPWTIFKNTNKLLPGTYLLVDNDKVSIHPYWDISDPDSLYSEKREYDFENESYNVHKDNIFSLLENAVKRRLISDVPLGAFLSGGIDSSIIVALMAKNSTKPVKTFSIGYKDLPLFNETTYAKEVAIFNKTDHHEFKLGFQDILDAFPKVLANFDEPFSDSSCVPTYIVSQETRNHVKVALSGDGGDELFAGYRMYKGEYWAGYYNMIPPMLRDQVIAPFMNLLPDSRGNPILEKVRRMKKFIRGMSSEFAERFCGWREIFDYSLRQKILKTPLRENFFLGYIKDNTQNFSPAFGDDNINLMLYLDLKGLLPGDMLTKVDRMSMVNSLEVRVPFLDHSLVEYVFRLKGDTKLKPFKGKKILIDSFKDYLPSNIQKREKWGFEMPIGPWLRKELRFLTDEYLSKKAIQKQDFFHYSPIKNLISDHMNGRTDTSWQLWNLIVFQYWNRVYL